VLLLWELYRVATSTEQRRSYRGSRFFSLRVLLWYGVKRS
jgi:hypothetical protein